MNNSPEHQTKHHAGEQFSAQGLMAGKVILVTGAGRGFGSGIARAVGLEGGAVCISDINDDELAQTAFDLKAEGVEVMAEHLDISNLQAFKHVVQLTVERYGRLDAVIQNAASLPLIAFEQISETMWWQQLHINLGGMFNAIKSCWDIFKLQGGGHVIGIGSGSSFRGFKNESVYCASKHAEEGLIKSLALESVPYKISLNTIGPGRKIKPTGITREQMLSIPSEEKATWADPSDLGKAFVWLISQPPGLFSGYRFDAGILVDTIVREGYNFDFSPEKVTNYVDDFLARKAWYENYPNS